ncbi:ATP-binding cassette sub-family C member Sur [Lepeophtheirus salmonis]|nr:ATP-binding cassette sub-family C member 9-like [Lepeophtheirus salmonis]
MSEEEPPIDESLTLCLSQIQRFYYYSILLKEETEKKYSNCVLEFTQISTNTLFCYIVTMIQVYLMISNSSKNSARSANGSGGICFGLEGINNGPIHARYVSHHFISAIYIFQFIVALFSAVEVVCFWSKTNIFMAVSFVDSFLFIVSIIASGAYFVSVEKRHLRYSIPLFLHYGANTLIQGFCLLENSDFRYIRTWCAFLLSTSYGLQFIFGFIGIIQRLYLRLVSNMDGPVYSKRPVIPQSHVYLYNEASSFSRLTFWWLNPILTQGYRAPLEIDDLHKLPKEERTKKYFQKLKTLLSRDKSSILWECITMNWSFVILGGLFRLFADILGYACALSINIIVNSIAAENENASLHLISNVTINPLKDTRYYDSFFVSELFFDPRVVSIVIFLAALGQGALSQTSNHLLTVSGIRAKNALHVLLYEKSLKLPVGSSNPMQIHRKINLKPVNDEGKGCMGGSCSLDEDYSNEGNIDIGFITNLASEDIINIRELIWNVHYIWSLPLKILVLLFLLYDQLGISGVSGAILGTCVILPLQVLTGKLMSENNKLILCSQDNRLFKSTETLASMKTVKLATMEEWALKRIRCARTKELIFLRRDSFLWSFMAFLASISTTLVTTLTLGLFVLLEDHNFTAADLFTSMALLSQLTVCLSVVPVTVPIFIKGKVSTQRLAEFLNRAEVSIYKQNNKLNKHCTYFDDRKDDDEEEEEEEEESEIFIQRAKRLPETCFTVENGTFAWPKCETNVLQSINLEIKTGSLTIVIGPSGSGKTALISSLIEEMDRITGSVKWNVPDTVALLGQRPWLLNTTIKDNILLGRPFKEKRYKKVIAACDLQTDIDLLPHGDDTEIGERGVLLSGGQRQRLAIARCLYSKSYCTFMDAPFSSLDSKITSHVFEEGVLKILLKRRRTVFLTTERLDFLHRADHIVALKDGMIKAQGTIQDVTRLCPELLSTKLSKNRLSRISDDNKGLVEGKTAQERWKLLRNVTKLGIKVKNKNTPKKKSQLQLNKSDDNFPLEISPVNSLLIRRHRSHSGGTSSGSSGGSFLFGKSLSQLPSSASSCKLYRSHLRIDSRSQSNLTHDLLLPSDEYIDYSLTEEEPSFCRVKKLSKINNGNNLFARTLSWNTNSKELSVSTSSSMNRSVVRRAKTPPNRPSNHAGEFQRMRSFIVNTNKNINLTSNRNAGGRSSLHRDSMVLSNLMPMHSNSEPEGFITDTVAPLKRRSIVLEPPHNRVMRLTSNSSQISSISGFSDDFFDEEEDEEGLVYKSQGGQSHENREYGSIDIGVLTVYFKAGGIFLAGFFVILSFVLQSVKVYMDFLLRDWSMEEKNSDKLIAYFSFYGSLSVIVILISCVANLIGQLIGARARTKLHNDMIQNIMYCPLELFEAFPIGRIINRISHDIFIVDQKIPPCIQRLIMLSFVCIAALAVNSIQSPVFLIFALPMISIYWWLQHFYRRSSRELQRLDSITRAPVLSHFSDTLSGLITVRAFGEQTRFINELCEKVDTNTSAFLILQSGCRWLGVYLDAAGAIFVFLSILVNLFFPRKGREVTSSASIGLSVNYSLLVPIYLAWVVKFAANIENYMNAVERVLEYTHFPSEEEDFSEFQAVHASSMNSSRRSFLLRGRGKHDEIEEDVRVSGDFLQNDSEGLIIRFNSVCLAPSFEYRRLPGIQQGFSLEIPYRQKVGICGRSGSGKSTLLMGIVRLSRVLQGSITINGININAIPLSRLRKFVITIPQDAVLFSGTIRSNLDPENDFSDELIWSTLDKADCGKTVRNFPDGLDTCVTENGDNFSLGQRQELNIVKALLRRPRVVILDESTSALDPNREVALHNTLLEAFEDSTLISVAHRLSNIVEYERVLVMGEGRILEDGNPKELLKKPMGFFSALWRAAGEKPLS